MKIGNLVISWGPQRFRLAQLEAALGRVKDKANLGVVVETIKGIVFDTFGLENGVPDDIAAATAAAQSSIATSTANISRNAETIAALQREITGLRANVQTTIARQAQLADIAKVFGTK